MRNTQLYHSVGIIKVTRKVVVNDHEMFLEVAIWKLFSKIFQKCFHQFKSFDSKIEITSCHIET